MRNSLDLWREGVWSPLRDLADLQKGFDRFFEDFSGRPSLVAQEWAFSPACDLDETESHFLVSLDMPGVAKDDIKIEVKENTLVISGERAQERGDKKGSRHLTERSYGKFERSFTLPATVDTTRIEASYENGVLHVAIPKAEAAKPRQIKIAEGKTGFFERLMGQKEKDRDVSPVTRQQA